jgi:hypothetical protein
MPRPASLAFASATFNTFSDESMSIPFPIRVLT